MFTRIAIAILLSAALASAEDKPHHIDFMQQLISINGKPLHIGDEKSEIMTLGDAVVNALEVVIDEDRNLDGKTKFERDRLARKVYKQKDVVLSVEEVAIIKERIGKVFGPSVIGVTWPLLDPSLKQ